MVNLGIRSSMAMPYQLALKYPNYNKNVDPNFHVKVFHAVIRANGKTSEEYIINAFRYIFLKMASD